MPYKYLHEESMKKETLSTPISRFQRCTGKSTISNNIFQYFNQYPSNFILAFHTQTKLQR